MINFLSHIMSVPFDIFYHDTTAHNADLTCRKTMCDSRAYFKTTRLNSHFVINRYVVFLAI